MAIAIFKAVDISLSLPIFFFRVSYASCESGTSAACSIRIIDYSGDAAQWTVKACCAFVNVKPYLFFVINRVSAATNVWSYLTMCVRDENIESL